MLTSNPMQQDPETQRRQALARVYALLVSLAESKEQPQAVDIEIKDLDPKKVTNDNQSK